MIRCLISLRFWLICLLVILGCTGRQLAPLRQLPMHQLSAAEVAQGQPLTAPDDFEPADPAWQVAGARQWRWIVIHHSSTNTGNAADFDRMHRARGWDELGYHFVIDNGLGGVDGRVEVGTRWLRQKWGSHTGNTPDNAYNNYGIGICLVGDFTNQMPTDKQLAALHELLTYLMVTYDIPVQNMIGHRDAPGASTECPGDMLWQYVHTELRAQMSQAIDPA